MKKLFILAALLMASTSAHAGGHFVRDRRPAHPHRGAAQLRLAVVPQDHGAGLQGIRSPSASTTMTMPAIATNAATIAPRATSRRRRNMRRLRPPPRFRRRRSLPLPSQPHRRRPRPRLRPPRRCKPTSRRALLRSPPGARAGPVAAAPASDPNTPLGVWATEENKGNVRIEPCGANLCGYAVKTNEKILISMKPTASKWSGQHPRSRQRPQLRLDDRDEGPNALRVQGCAFGGMFCGGQTWKRVS